MEMSASMNWSAIGWLTNVTHLNEIAVEYTCTTTRLNSSCQKSHTIEFMQWLGLKMDEAATIS